MGGGSRGQPSIAGRFVGYTPGMDVVLLVLLVLAGLLGAAVLLGMLAADRAMRALGGAVLLIAIIEVLARTA